MNTQVGDFRTANKRIRIEQTRNGRWGRGGLQELIQALADEGYDCLGKINEYIPTGSVAAHTEDFLFVKSA